jgi:mannose-6-phosphate isomerase-like protein (cupin superfamily)
MEYYIRLREAKETVRYGVVNYSLLTDAHGCTAGCCTGISIFSDTEYSVANTHEDQEGFFVIEGEGWARVGETEFRIEPDTSFIVPAGFSHTIKRDPNSPQVRVFWFHAAI